ncbi:MAG: hypothetical protein DMG97_33275 [Acidobacteria bacterium]|nr:MAG: hypothetical protein DMG97_33275 [Acidobacteriota bacterium]
MAGINPEGQVVGFAETETVDSNNPPFLESRAFLWQKGEARWEVTTAPPTPSTANTG